MRTTKNLGWHSIYLALPRRDGLYAYRVEDATGAIAYIPDHVFSEGVSDAARELVAGVDVLLHDAQFVEGERALADAYGHSTIGDAVDLALACGAGSLTLFHHGPARTDDALDEIARSVTYIETSLTVTVAQQGVEIPIPVRR